MQANVVKTWSKSRKQTTAVLGRYYLLFYHIRQYLATTTIVEVEDLQKVRDGEHLGGKASAESDFATDDDDDFLS